MSKVLNIESQQVDSYPAANFLHLALTIAKEAGYTIVHDHWGYRALDEMNIDEALKKFTPKYEDDDK